MKTTFDPEDRASILKAMPGSWACWGGCDNHDDIGAWGLAGNDGGGEAK